MADGRPTLPTFLVIGAMKSGTTSLYEYLRAHPQVFMPEVKELDFFAAAKNWPRGLDWYAAHFAGAAGARAVGEASPAYANDPNHPGVPERIHSVLPDVKLVYVIRNPIDRIESHYRHRVRYEGEQAGADAAVLADLPRYLPPSRYAHQIDRYLEWFPRERLLVVLSDDLKADRVATLARIHRFIGVDAAFSPDVVNAEFLRNPPSRRSRWLRARRRSSTPSRLSAPVRTELAQMLRSDRLRLREIMGEDFDAWGLD